MQHLIVTNDFADWKRGDRITDPDLVQSIPQGANHGNVVRVQTPDQPAPAVASTPSKS